MIAQWKASPTPVDNKEICKRLIDLFLVSVLLDAGAGNSWAYKEPGTDMTFTRSEGLGVASFHMFNNGFFSGSATVPCRVDCKSFFSPFRVVCANEDVIWQITIVASALIFQPLALLVLLLCQPQKQCKSHLKIP